MSYDMLLTNLNARQAWTSSWLTTSSTSWWTGSPAPGSVTRIKMTSTVRKRYDGVRFRNGLKSRTRWPLTGRKGIFSFYNEINLYILWSTWRSKLSPVNNYPNFYNDQANKKVNVTIRDGLPLLASEMFSILDTGKVWTTYILIITIIIFIMAISNWIDFLGPSCS